MRENTNSASREERNALDEAKPETNRTEELPYEVVISKLVARVTNQE
jgi:hypothetical protein